MKTLIIACVISLLGPNVAVPDDKPVFVCGACKKEFAACSSCGLGPDEHMEVNHVPMCKCGGFGRKK